ncbi:MAG: DUF4924 family protein [Bacteroidota bacterium]
MIIAKQKKQENIAEYVLYMWQIEDLLRALKFDEKLIEEQLVEQYNVPENEKTEIRNWYKGLVWQMTDEDIRDKGHLQFVNNQVNDLNEHHLYLMQAEDEETYHQVFEMARPNLVAFREKAKDTESNDVQLAFNALYSLLVLRLQAKKINKETEQAMTSFSNFLGLLSQKYKDFHSGEEGLKA